MVKNLSLNPLALQSIIDLQEKMHFNICRHRSLASIGLHDYKKIKFPLHYTAETPG